MRPRLPRLSMAGVAAAALLAAERRGLISAPAPGSPHDELYCQAATLVARAGVRQPRERAPKR